MLHLFNGSSCFSSPATSVHCVRRWVYHIHILRCVLRRQFLPIPNFMLVSRVKMLPFFAFSFTGFLSTLIAFLNGHFHDVQSKKTCCQNGQGGGATIGEQNLCYFCFIA